MATENTVSFKVFISKEDSPNESEVRRFGIDRDVVSNFGYLKEKLQMIFPSLKGKTFTVHWKDSDNDSIIITSDEELIIALTEMQIDVRKLYVVVRQSSEQHQPQGSSILTTHAGVTCDGCNKPVQGFRYKCVQCPDFDLCSTCENANLHSEHFMIRVPMPINWNPCFGRRLVHRLSKSARKGGYAYENMCGEPQEGNTCSNAGAYSCPYPPRGHHGRNRGHRHGLNGHNWLETLSNYLSEWTNLPGETDPTNPSANTATDTTQPQKEQMTQEHQHVKFLKTVGQTVAQLLDPLGIDVDVEVRTKTGTDTKVEPAAKNEENAAVKNVRFSDDVHETVVKEVATKVNDLTISDKPKESNNGAVPKVSTSNLQPSPESDGWTVVNEMETGPVASASQQTLTPAPVPNSSNSFYETAHQSASMAAQQTMMAYLGKIAGNQNGITLGNQVANETSHQTSHQAPHAAAYQQDVANAHQTMWEAQNLMATSGNNNIYPHLASQAPSQNSLAHEQPPFHPRPHINAAVQQMMSMGFTNDGGWLTQLVETQNGDISKVFDILQPVKK